MPTRNNNISLSPVPTQKASESIYEQISELIMSGQLKPGDRLPSERAMMEQLQRSRPTIREALRMLERSGLIRTIPGSNGAVVTTPSSSSIEQPLENMIAMNTISSHELLELREVVERNSVKWAAERRTDADITSMKKILKDAEMNSEDFEEFVKHDLAFHQAIFKAGQNKLAAMIDKVIHRMILDVLKESYIKKNPEERKQMTDTIILSHKRILKAIEEKDQNLAYEYMTKHIERFSSDI